MLAPLSWLKDYVDIDIDEKEFGDKMTLTGTKLESIEKRSTGKLKNVVSAKVLAMAKHENSDHMWVCDIDDGTEVKVIVTGAQNVSVGDIVPLAKDNSVLDNGTQIVASELRGVMSYGMLCSGEELGIASNIIPKFAQDGIYILPKDTALGVEVSEILGLNDSIFDFELTNNRQDCNSMLGVAYEAAATLGRKFEFPKYEYESEKDDISNYISIEIENYEACRRYTARMLKITKIEASPIWMQTRLMASGVRPINNIVDVANFVMLETGQPLHTFDYAKLAGKKIVVKNATDGDVMTTLDGVERILTKDTLMIDDGEKHIAIAGVMGGGNSDIDENTDMIVIESANFEKNSIRKSSKHFGLRTEASAHYEKGISVNLTRYAADRTASLLVELGAAEYIDGVIDNYKALDERKEVSMDMDWFNAFIGIELGDEEIVSYLERLHFEPVVEGREVKVLSPIYRQDIESKADIAEEVVRMYGYDKIPAPDGNSSSFVAPTNVYYNMKNKLKSIIMGIGAFEILTYSFISPTKQAEMNYADDDIRKVPAVVINPLGEDNSVMRTTLLTGLLDSLALNYNRKNRAELMFELGSVYYKNLEIEEKLPAQVDKICIGKYDTDFYEIKAVVNFLFDALKIDGVKYVRSSEPTLHPGISADVLVGGDKIGYVGQIHPRLAKKYSLKENVVVCELDVLTLIDLYTSNEIKSVPLNKFPTVLRDLALVVDEETLAGEVSEIIIQNGGEFIDDCKPFDVYRSDALGKDKKSIAYTISFKKDNATLTDVEIDEAITSILTALKEQGISIRE